MIFSMPRPRACGHQAYACFSNTYSQHLQCVCCAWRRGKYCHHSRSCLPWEFNNLVRTKIFDAVPPRRRESRHRLGKLEQGESSRTPENKQAIWQSLFSLDVVEHFTPPKPCLMERDGKFCW